MLGAKDKRSPSQFWVDGMILGYKVLRSGSQSRNRPLMAEYYRDLAVLQVILGFSIVEFLAVDEEYQGQSNVRDENADFLHCHMQCPYYYFKNN
jgi:hypothetical protein